MSSLPIEYAVRNLGRSPSRLVLSVAGSALVVVLVLTAAGFVRGMDLSLRSTGGAWNVLIMGAGSEESVERSEVSPAAPGIVEASIPGVRRAAGVAYVSPEVHVMLPVALRADRPARHQVMIRGVTPAATLVHDDVRLAEGRLPRSGADEIVIGAMVPARLGTSADDVSVGRSLVIDGRAWTIVGRFVAPGTVLEAEIWAPISDVMTATKRQSISCITMTLDPERGEFADVAAFVKTRVDLELAAMPERAYYAQLAGFYAPIRMVTWVTALLVTLGGLLGGLTTMYAAFASRVRELGTLQALGYPRRAIVASLMQEASLATAAGALVACVIAATLLDGLAVRFSLGAFGLMIDAPVLVLGLATGVMLGVLGALPPAWRCLRLPVPVALKSV